MTEPRQYVDRGGISSASIRNPIPTIVFFLVMIVAGWGAFNALRINNFPDVDLPVVSVTVLQSGAAPAELETQVTRIIENSVAGLGSVKHINSYVNDGVSTTVVQFQLGVDLEKSTNDVRNAVAGVRANLPSDVLDPIVRREEASGEPLITYIIRGDGMNPEQLSWFVDNDISKKVLAKNGVSKVTRDGGVDREIRIDLDPGLLAGQGITASEVSQQLRNININLPGGRLEVGGSEQSIRTLGNANSVEILRDTRINLNNGQSVRLGDLGQVSDTWSEPRTRARFNGQEVVGFAVYRTIGSSEVDVAKGIREAIDEIRTAHPGIVLEEVTASVDWVNESYIASMETLAIGALLAVLVVWLFLRDWRATLISATAMPLSLLPTFFVMWVMNESFNIVSLLALSLTIGILVDDAIVEIENIVRHIRDGKKPYQAAIEAADEIGLAVVATTATIIAVFAPVGFMPGIVGQFFKSFAVAACVSVFFSLVVARTITPLMGAYLMRSDPGKEHPDPFWMKNYLKTLNWGLSGHLRFMTTRVALTIFGVIVLALTGLMVFGGVSGALKAPTGFDPMALIGPAITLIIGGLIVFACFKKAGKLPRGEKLRTRWAVLAIGIGFFIGSMAVAGLLPGEFIPVGDNGRSFLKVELPPGSRLNETDKVVNDLMAEISQREGVKSVYASVDINSANFTINLVPRHDRKFSQQEFETDFNQFVLQYPGIRSTFGQEGGGGGITSFTLVSDDPVALAEASRELERQMRGLPELTNVSSADNLTRPEIIVVPKPDQAALMGVSAAAISQAARVATVGDFDQILAKYNVGDRQIPIRVLLKTDARTDVANLNDLKVPTKFGTSVPLAAVADITFAAGPVQINRTERSRSATIKGNIANGIAAGIAQDAVRALPAMKNLPPQVKEIVTGEQEDQAEMATGFMIAISTGIMLMYVVLVLLFKSFTHPVTILTALPLSFGGAFFLLLVTGKSMSMPALIGLIMLTGIAAKNSILLVEYAIEAIKHGMTRHDGLMDAAHKRARPILMTTVAMGAGMLPIAVGWGADVAFRSPMAIAVIGGLITSTLLSLLFVPVAYTFIDDISQFFGRHTKKYFTAEGKEDDVKSQSLAE
ncbi:efflux RND transporter permease subunit [Asticcacaulis sp. ZE23SCel15]|uniref:efflux RND transporter permease subunit n=1 Tax=Asticcacaulis sp. ZE23SCel15 TaxID=3059027 RepID=UPI00265DD978|nr:efflux RND transporter permease subunit [Asticcacaulis sp. ZE23SCel15]WKL57091.1 efflux RND transporter permease subunit [Asticcacaulis sp. ZE23SCel15]